MGLFSELSLLSNCGKISHLSYLILMSLILVISQFWNINVFLHSKEWDDWDKKTSKKAKPIAAKTNEER